MLMEIRKIWLLLLCLCICSGGVSASRLPDRVVVESNRRTLQQWQESAIESANITWHRHDSSVVPFRLTVTHRLAGAEVEEIQHIIRHLRVNEEVRYGVGPVVVPDGASCLDIVVGGSSYHILLDEIAAAPNTDSTWLLPADAWQKLQDLVQRCTPAAIHSGAWMPRRINEPDDLSVPQAIVWSLSPDRAVVLRAVGSGTWVWQFSEWVRNSSGTWWEKQHAITNNFNQIELRIRENTWSLYVGNLLDMPEVPTLHGVK